MPRVLDPYMKRLLYRYTTEPDRPYVAHQRQLPRLFGIMVVHERHHVDGKDSGNSVLDWHDALFR